MGRPFSVRFIDASSESGIEGSMTLPYEPTAEEKELYEEHRGIPWEHWEKWYSKARVYGAIANRFRQALEDIQKVKTFSDASALAEAALRWRISEGKGVPIDALKEMGRIIAVDEKNARQRERIAELEKRFAHREDAAELIDKLERLREAIERQRKEQEEDPEFIELNGRTYRLVPR